MNLGPTVNSSSFDGFPDISTDGLALFFMSERPDGFGGRDLWLSRRRTTNESWGIPINLGPTVNTSAIEFSPDISADGYTIYFVSDRPGGFGSWDLWQASIIPIIDLNGDGIVDAADMCIVVDYWGTDEPLCDIGPMPWGDGVVDVEDLKVLSEHLFEQVDDSTLISHWALDEAQGDIAYNSATDCDGILIGDPVWQPDVGILAGALQLDGIDDYVITDPVLNPVDGVFSVIAWIKGGIPGQVVLSQTGGANWLSADPSDGNLMTEIKSHGRSSGGTLLSRACITDINWHRIGLVWDGSYRHLYVDEVEVAKDDAQLSGLEDVYGGLYIGTGKNMETGTFFSGLIDDVRIYNRVVIP